MPDRMFLNIEPPRLNIPKVPQDLSGVELLKSVNNTLDTVLAHEMKNWQQAKVAEAEMIGIEEGTTGEFVLKSPGTLAGDTYNKSAIKNFITTSNNEIDTRMKMLEGENFANPDGYETSLKAYNDGYISGISANKNTSFLADRFSDRIRLSGELSAYKIRKQYDKKKIDEEIALTNESELTILTNNITPDIFGKDINLKKNGLIKYALARKEYEIGVNSSFNGTRLNTKEEAVKKMINFDKTFLVTSFKQYLNNIDIDLDLIDKINNDEITLDIPVLDENEKVIGFEKKKLSGSIGQKSQRALFEYAEGQMSTQVSRRKQTRTKNKKISENNAAIQGSIEKSNVNRIDVLNDPKIRQKPISHYIDMLKDGDILTKDFDLIDKTLNNTDRNVPKETIRNLKNEISFGIDKNDDIDKYINPRSPEYDELKKENFSQQKLFTKTIMKDHVRSLSEQVGYNMFDQAINSPETSQDQIAVSKFYADEIKMGKTPEESYENSLKYVDTLRNTKMDTLRKTPFLYPAYNFTPTGEEKLTDYDFSFTTGYSSININKTWLRTVQAYQSFLISEEELRSQFNKIKLLKQQQKQTEIRGL